MKTMLKREYKQLIVAMLIFFGLLAIISSVSACPIPEDFDKGHKTFNIQNNEYKTSWNAYTYSNINNGKIYVNRYYKLKNKKNKTVFRSESNYEISKVKKNRIKVLTYYSNGSPKGEVKIYKSKLSVRTFYWRYIETKFTSKFDRKILSKSSIIDEGKLEAILPYNSTSNKNITTLNHWINWKVKTHTKFPKIISIEQNYDNNIPESDIIRNVVCGGSIPDSSFYDSYITLEKTKKNKIKVTIKNMDKINGDSIKDRIYTVKTNLSLKNYYFKVFKPKMIKMFSLS